MPSSVRKEASAILHAHRQVRQFWRARVSLFQPSERPVNDSVVVDITRCGVPGLVCVADRNSPLSAVTTGSVRALAAVVSRRAVAASGSAGRRPLSTGSLMQVRRMISVPMLARVGR
jgi:hypothetical protein